MACLAQTLALNGLDVLLVDQIDESLDRAGIWIRENLEFLAKLNLIQPSGIGKALDKITFAEDLNGPAVNADYVLAAITENLELKKDFTITKTVQPKR